MAKITIKDITPKMGLPGGHIKILGKNFQPWEMDHYHLRFPNSTAWIEAISENTLLTSIPSNTTTGDVFIEMGGYRSNKYHFIVPEPVIDGLNLVDNPVTDSQGNIYATYSGNKGELSPVSVYKILKNNEKEVYISGITNATSLLIDKNDNLYIASRFDGKIYKSSSIHQYEVFSQGLGAAFGIAINSLGELFVGDRTGSIFKVNSNGQASFYTSVPQSYIAFHLAFDKLDNLYVSNPIHMGENTIFKIEKNTTKPVVYYTGLSLFHGFAFDQKNNLYLAETKRNESRVIKIKNGQYQSTILTGTKFIGLTFDQKQNLIIATASSIYTIEKGDY